MAKLTVKDVDLSGKRVLVRVDFNVPLDEKDGQMIVTDDTRIKETIPTLDYLIEKGATILLCSHLGRPKGKADPKQSLRPAAAKLSDILGRPVAFVAESILEAAGQEKVRNTVSVMKPGDILVLENTRFYAGEEKNDEALGKVLGSFCDVYVNDAFGSAHRAHSSTEAVARFAPLAVSGLLMERELKFLGDELEQPGRPFVVILGGAKVSDKITVIDRLLEKADSILIGGAMAYTFKHALGEKIGKSLCEADKVDTAKAALEKAKQRGVKFLLPVDDYIVQELDFAAKKAGPGQTTAPGAGVPDGWMGVDIGPETIKLYSEEIARAKTVLWNGPMGVFEIKELAKGTFAVAEAVAKNEGATSIIGGGDSVKAIKKSGFSSKVTFMSTGGGASLEFLEGKVLPGVAALKEK
jgi:phosphoglycerate kinase